MGRLLPFRLPLVGLAGPYRIGPQTQKAVGQHLIRSPVTWPNMENLPSLAEHVNILLISSIIDQMNMLPEPFPVTSYNFRHSENYRSSRVKV